MQYALQTVKQRRDFQCQSTMDTLPQGLQQFLISDIPKRLIV